MGQEVKCLKLEDLKIGMMVSLEELDGIVGVPITLRASSIDFSSPDKKGEIVSIGDLGKENIVEGDSVFIYNLIDFTEDGMTDDRGYDQSE